LNSDGLRTVEVMDAIGNKLLIQSAINSYNSTIDISKLSNGIYVVKTTNINNIVQVTKLVIQH
jgi:ribosomal protein L31